MDTAIKHHLNKTIINRQKLTGGYTFNTWLLTLSGGEKIIFRARQDFETGGGRKIIISDVLEREKFFYEGINKKIGRFCPKVYVVDGSKQFYETSFCIMEYIEGIPLNQCFDSFDETHKNAILYKIGEIAAQINGIKINCHHPYIKNRASWGEYMAGRLKERLIPLLPSGAIRQDEAEDVIEKMRQAKDAFSFLHLDLRRINMVYDPANHGLIILDAENCEFGCPLFEIATIDVANELAPALSAGYKSVHGHDPDMGGELYLCYKLERLALVLNLFMNVNKTNKQQAGFYLDKFLETKNKLLFLK